MPTLGWKSAGLCRDGIVKNAGDTVQGADVDGVALNRLDLLLDLLGTESLSQSVLGLQKLLQRSKRFHMKRKRSKCAGPWKVQISS